MGFFDKLNDFMMKKTTDSMMKQLEDPNSSFNDMRRRFEKMNEEMNKNSQTTYNGKKIDTEEEESKS